MVDALAELKQAMIDATRDQATAHVFHRVSRRRQRLRDAARRHVKAGAVAMSRTGRFEDFARAALGNMSAQHFRSLGQLTEGDLRRELAAAGFERGELQDPAIARVEEAIARRFQETVRDRALRAIRARASEFRAAAEGLGRTPPDRASVRLLGSIWCQGRQGESLRQFEMMGVDVAGVRAAIQAGQVDGRDAFRALLLALPPVLRHAAEQLDDVAATIAGWDRSDLEDAVASEAFSQIDQQIRAEWAMNGIVGQAVTGHISDARARGQIEEEVFNDVVIVAAIVVSLATGSPVPAGIGAVIREGREIYLAWEQADLSAAAAMAGVGETATAAADRHHATVTTAVGVVSGVADTLFASLTSAGHHRVVQALKDAAEEGSEEALKSVLQRFIREHPEVLSDVEAGSDLASAIVEFAGALGIDVAKHQVEHAVEEHH